MATLYSTSSLTAPATAFLLLLCLLAFVLPRRVAIMPLMVSVTLMTLAQQIVIFDCHFTFPRVLILCGVLRIAVRREFSVGSNTSLDKAFKSWVAVSLVCGLILEFSVRQFINRSGFAFDAAGTYLLTRTFVTDKAEIERATKILILVSFLISIGMLVEKFTGRNIFYIFGGVPEFTIIREGRLRAQGPFTHPIHAGTFGATLAPLCVALSIQRGSPFAIAGSISSTIMTLAAASSGPLIAWLYGLLSLATCRIRNHMCRLRRLLVVGAILLQLMMQAPIWYLIARITSIPGVHGTGWWRANIIDQFVKHFTEWWFVGTTYTAHWSPTGSGLPMYPNHADLTNQFVAEGVNGGLLKLLLFVFVIVQSFKAIGLAATSGEGIGFRGRIFVWGLGCSLFAHTMSFISVSYSEEAAILYYILIGMIGCVSQLNVSNVEMKKKNNASADKSLA